MLDELIDYLNGNDNAFARPIKMGEILHYLIDRKCLDKRHCRKITTYNNEHVQESRKIDDAINVVSDCELRREYFNIEHNDITLYDIDIEVNIQHYYHKVEFYTDLVYEMSYEVDLINNEFLNELEHEIFQYKHRIKLTQYHLSDNGDILLKIFQSPKYISISICFYKLDSKLVNTLVSFYHNGLLSNVKISTNDSAATTDLLNQYISQEELDNIIQLYNFCSIFGLDTSNMDSLLSIKKAC